MYVYLASDVGLPRRQLIGLPFGPNGWRGEPRTLAARDDAELEWIDADDAGALLLLVWNAAGAIEYNRGNYARARDLFRKAYEMGYAAARQNYDIAVSMLNRK